MTIDIRLLTLVFIQEVSDVDPTKPSNAGDGPTVARVAA